MQSAYLVDDVSKSAEFGDESRLRIKQRQKNTPSVSFILPIVNGVEAGAESVEKFRYTVGDKTTLIGVQKIVQNYSRALQHNTTWCMYLIKKLLSK